MDGYYLALAIVTLLSASPGLYYAVLSVREAGADHERAIVALYGASRSLALFVLAVVPVAALPAGGAPGWLAAAAVSMVIVQGIDAFVGIRRRSPVMVAGPAFLSAAVLVALVLFLTRSA